MLTTITENKAIFGSPSQLFANPSKWIALKDWFNIPLVGSIIILKIAVIIDVAIAIGIK